MEECGNPDIGITGVDLIATLSSLMKVIAIYNR